jgi:hypothetical protein
MNDLFSIVLIAILFVGGIWSLNVKRREFLKFVKENGWSSVRSIIRNFFIRTIKLTGLVLGITFYFLGLILIPLYFEGSNETLASWLTVGYLLIGIFTYYYITGIKRRYTKNIVLIFKTDLADFKKNTLRTVKDVYGLTVILLKFAGILFVIILAVVLFGWFIASLSSMTIIIFLLILILLK